MPARRPPSARPLRGLGRTVASLATAVIVVLVLGPGRGPGVTSTAGAATTAAKASRAAKSPGKRSPRRSHAKLDATAANGLRCRPRRDRPAIVRRESRPAKRQVALTFDDGPSVYTGRTLDALRRAKVPATFFVIGRQIRPYRSLVRRIVAEGHALGNHTWSHANVSGGGALTGRQMRDTQHAIQQAVGRAGCLMRPPGGAVGPGLTRWLKQHGTLGVLWDVDVADYRRPPAATMVRQIVARARPGSIILLHDGGGNRANTVAAIPGIVRGLKARRMQFVTVPELLRLPRAR